MWAIRFFGWLHDPVFMTKNFVWFFTIKKLYHDLCVITCLTFNKSRKSNEQIPQVKRTPNQCVRSRWVQKIESQRAKHFWAWKFQEEGKNEGGYIVGGGICFQLFELLVSLFKIFDSDLNHTQSLFYFFSILYLQLLLET